MKPLVPEKESDLGMGALGKVLLAVVKAVVLTWGLLTTWAYRFTFL